MSTLTDEVGTIRAERPRAVAKKSRLLVLWANACNGKWVSHIALSLAEEMSRHIETRMHAHMWLGGPRSPVVVPAVPPWSNRVSGRLDGLRPFLHARTAQRYLRDVTPDDICWLWPADVQHVARELHSRGIATAAEAINCHQHTAREILCDAYRRLGWAPYRGINDSGIERENDLYRCASWVFAPSPLVADSLILQGVPEKKIVRTSYGWSPRRFAGQEHEQKPNDVFTALFVGSLCVRKGPHLLAAAWRDAGIAGRLVFAGPIEEEFGRGGMSLVSAPGAEHLGHTDRVPALMRESHVLMFPTLEEGSPLVIYEAAAMGLAIVTTPMGAGEVIRHGKEGIVLDPYDHDAWVETIRRLAGDPDLRARLGAAAKERAQEFTWDKVARRRLEIWRDRI